MKRASKLVVFLLCAVVSVAAAQDKVTIAKTYDIKAPKKYDRGFTVVAVDGMSGKNLQIIGSGYNFDGSDVQAEYLSGKLSTKGKLRQIQNGNSGYKSRIYQGENYNYTIDSDAQVRVYSKDGSSVTQLAPIRFPEVRKGAFRSFYSFGLAVGPESVAVVACRTVYPVGEEETPRYNQVYFNQISLDGSSIGAAIEIFNFDNSSGMHVAVGDPMIGKRNNWIIPISSGKRVSSEAFGEPKFNTDFYTGTIKASTVKPAANTVKLKLIYKSNMPTDYPWATFFSVAHKSGFYIVQALPQGGDSAIHFIKTNGKRAAESVPYALTEWDSPDINVEGKRIEFEEWEAGALQPVLDPEGNILLPRTIASRVRLIDENDPGIQDEFATFGRADVYKFKIEDKTFSIVAKSNTRRFNTIVLEEDGQFGYFDGSSYWVLSSSWGFFTGDPQDGTVHNTSVTIFKLIK